MFGLHVITFSVQHISLLGGGSIKTALIFNSLQVFLQLNSLARLATKSYQRMFNFELAPQLGTSKSLQKLRINFQRFASQTWKRQNKSNVLRLTFIAIQALGTDDRYPRGKTRPFLKTTNTNFFKVLY